MSITREKIKRLEKEATELDPTRRLLRIAVLQEDGLIYHNQKTYKTIAELEKKEGLKEGRNLKLVEEVIADFLKQCKYKAIY